MVGLYTSQVIAFPFSPSFRIGRNAGEIEGTKINYHVLNISQFYLFSVQVISTVVGSIVKNPI